MLKIYLEIYLFEISLNVSLRFNNYTHNHSKNANKKSYGKCPIEKNATVAFLSGREYAGLPHFYLLDSILYRYHASFVCIVTS